MIQRSISFLLLGWVLGFAWFALLMPMPAPPQKTDAIVVLTGGPGRIDRALDRLEAGDAKRLLISGVDRDVKPHELALEYRRPRALFECCVALGYEATDTRSNAVEVTRWVARRNYRSIRLVTTDWHMRRAQHEIGLQLDKDVVVVTDAVRSRPSLPTLIDQYHKYLYSLAGGLIGV